MNMASKVSYLGVVEPFLDHLMTCRFVLQLAFYIL